MRQVKFPVAAINIAVNPHPEKVYEKLLAAAFALRKALAIHGDRHALLLQLDKPRSYGTNASIGISGVLATFLDLDIDAPWFDTAELQVVKEDQKKTIQIPESLRPNMAEFLFIFDMRSHILICQSRTEIVGRRRHPVRMTGKMLANYFGELFATPSLVREFGKVEVTAIPDADKVNAILTSKIRKLFIVLRAPNPDSLEGLSHEIQERMRKTHSKQLEEIATASSGELLKPDKRMEDLAKVAAKNGRVEANIETGAGVKHVSTLESPAEFTIKRDNRELDSAVIQRAAEYAIERISPPSKEKTRRRKSR